jgi:hypothetical protein
MANIDFRAGPSIRRNTNSNPTQTLGTSGAILSGGFLVTGEQDARLQGTQKYKTYSDLLANISIVAAGTRYFLNLVAKAKWKVEPAKDKDDGSGSSKEAEKKAKEFEKVFKETETPWHRIVRRSAMYRFYGFSVQEWTAEARKDGIIGFKDIAPRPQKTITRWDVDEVGKVHGMVQTNPNTFKDVFLPRNKTVYIVDDSLNDDPEGLGLFRHIIEASKRLKRYEELEGFGYETDLRGIPVARAPLSALNQAVKDGSLTDAQNTTMQQPILNFLQNHIKNPELGMLLDSSVYRGLDEASTPSRMLKWDIDVIKGEGAGAGLQEIAQAIERLNREIARVLGVEQLLLGSNDRGSFAMAESKSENFLLIINSTLQEIAATYEQDLVKRMWELNGWDEDLMPTLTIEPVAFRDAAQIAAALKDLSASGVVLSPDDPAILELFDLMGLSRPTKTIQDLFGDATLQDRGSISRDISAGRARGPERQGRAQDAGKDKDDKDEE